MQITHILHSENFFYGLCITIVFLPQRESRHWTYKAAIPTESRLLPMPFPSYPTAVFPSASRASSISIPERASPYYDNSDAVRAYLYA